jgi:hypothetical protein
MKTEFLLKLFNEDGTEKAPIAVRRPSVMEIRHGQMAYSAAYAEAMRAGVLPRKSMLRLMEEKGVWGDPERKAISDLNLKIEAIESALGSASGGEVVVAGLTVSVVEAKSTLLAFEEEHAAMREEFRSILENTAEAIAWQAKHEDIALSVATRDGKRLWKDVEECASDPERDSVVFFVDAILRGRDPEEDLAQLVPPEDGPEEESVPEPVPGQPPQETPADNGSDSQDVLPQEEAKA